ncbi:MAG: PspC domain-containing protein [Bacteroidales bacterium]|nr:PspC domain-containing protein [Bacteroidales bacterium]
MKPVENVSIGGYVFSLEDDACAVCRKYLGELDSFYSGKESGSEIMEGIEERMSELLLEQSGRGGVVTLQMVDSVIATLGRPEAIEEDDEPRTQGEGPEPKVAQDAKDGKPKKKLYRDPSNGKLAGVCSGLGAYFSVDPTVIRVLFVVFTLIPLGIIFSRGWLRFPDGLFPLIYLVLWLCMPVAKTVRQKDELYGNKGTVDDISARVMGAVQEMGDAAETVIRSDFWTGAWRIIALCLGILVLVAGVAGVVTLGCLSIGDNFLTGSFFYNKIVEEIAIHNPRFLDLLSYPPYVAALAICLAFPFIGLIYLGVMLIFGLKSPKWHPGLWLFVIWLVALTVLAVLSMMFLLKGTL